MTAGARMRREISEQPRVLDDLVRRRSRLTADLRTLAPVPLRGFVVCARGSSDNAAVYGRYVLERATGRPVALAAPSLHTRYGVVPDLDGFLAIAISQSGETPEIVDTISALAAGGAATVAVTNARDAALAGAADITVPLDAGPERAVPATKTFTAQLVGLAILADALGPDSGLRDAFRPAVAAVEAAVDTPGPAAAAAAAIDGARHVVTVGRGFLYAAALEAGLKLAEVTGLPVHASSPTDLLHGPIATVSDRTHALCLATPGPVAADTGEAADALRGRGAAILSVADTPDLLPDPNIALPVPSVVPEPLAPVGHTVRVQQLALELALRRGIDPDEPFSLSKVTPTT